MKPFAYIVDGILAIAIIFLFTFMYFGYKQDSVTTTLVHTDIVNLADEVRSKGYLNKAMYEEFLSQLHKTGLIYDIYLEHRKNEYEPRYRFRSEDEVIDSQNGDFSGKNEYIYRPVKSDIPIVDDKSYEGSLNNQTNESILAASINTPASSDHVHTEACYSGHRHTDGFGISTSSYYHGCYINATYSSVSCCGTLQMSGTSVSSSGGGCPHCGAYVTFTSTIYYLTCNRCGNTCGYWGPAFWRCGKCGYSGSSGGMSPPVGAYCGVSTNVVTGYQCSLQEDTTPDCSLVVKSISPTNTLQTVYIGDSIITTALVTYLDGATKTMICPATGYDKTKLGEQMVTLSYTGLVDNAKTNGTKTCTEKVTVVPKSKKCLNGHTYNLNLDGSDPGCPYCREWLSCLKILTPDTGSITIYKGTTLQENGVVLLATYFDGHVENVTNDYLDNLDNLYVGTQNVTIGYKGLYVTLKVITKRNLKLCPVCKRYYELYPDNSDPGCPYCVARTPVFTGEVMNYNEKSFTNDIIKELYEGSGTYYFSIDDYFRIKVQNASRSIGGKLTTAIFKTFADGSIRTECGGYIRESGQ